MKMLPTKLYIALQDAWTRDEGQTMAEYAIILAVIVVAVIGTLTFLSGGITKTLSSVTSRL
jgi:Flp pilus assembly pilin Flp